MGRGVSAGKLIHRRSPLGRRSADSAADGGFSWVESGYIWITVKAPAFRRDARVGIRHEGRRSFSPPIHCTDGNDGNPCIRRAWHTSRGSLSWQRNPVKTLWQIRKNGEDDRMWEGTCLEVRILEVVRLCRFCFYRGRPTADKEESGTSFSHVEAAESRTR